MSTQKVLHGLNTEVLKTFPDDYFHSVVTDPPYGLGKEPDIVEVMKDWVAQGYHIPKNKSGFMGKEWDAFVPQPATWKEIYRVLKPGGYMLVACGTRTQDLMTISLRFAGFEIRDVITWHYGSGFPKSLNISKAIDEYLGAERPVVGTKITNVGIKGNNFKNKSQSGEIEITSSATAEATAEATEFAGYGTALKPATEFWTLCRKPLSEDTVAKNVLEHGTGGINIDACRIQINPEIDSSQLRTINRSIKSNNNWGMNSKSSDTPRVIQSIGRFPANVIFDEFTAPLLDEQSGELTSGAMKKSYEYTNTGTSMGYPSGSTKHLYEASSVGASRFFYVAKASKSERNKGLENLGFKKVLGHSRFDTCKNCGGYILQTHGRDSHCSCDNPERENLTVTGNFHTTVKPVKLMQYLVRLVTPKGGHYLDPYNGSGTTGIACKIEDFDYTGIDAEEDYVQISKHRIAAWQIEKEDYDNQLAFEFPNE